MFKRKRQPTNNLILDSENAVVIANILKVNETLVVPVPVCRMLVFDTNGVKEVDSGFRITQSESESIFGPLIFFEFKKY